MQKYVVLGLLLDLQTPSQDETFSPVRPDNFRAKKIYSNLNKIPKIILIKMMSI